MSCLATNTWNKFFIELDPIDLLLVFKKFLLVFCSSNELTKRLTPHNNTVVCGGINGLWNRNYKIIKCRNISHAHHHVLQPIEVLFSFHELRRKIQLVVRTRRQLSI